MLTGVLASFCSIVQCSSVSMIDACPRHGKKRGLSLDKSKEKAAVEEEGSFLRRRPRRSCRDAPAAAQTAELVSDQASKPLPLKGKILVVHANGKTYGHGPAAASASSCDGSRVAAAKKSNMHDFAFSAADYIAMRDGGVYSGDPRVNKLLPLPRPTYTEFINRAKSAKALSRLFFLYCPATSPCLPRLDYASYERVVYAGVSFRRFKKVWRPELHHLFKNSFKETVMQFLLARNRLARSSSSVLGIMPDVLVHEILACASSPADALSGRAGEYDCVEEINSGRRHLFLPAPGSSGLRDHLFDAVFGL